MRRTLTVIRKATDPLKDDQAKLQLIVSIDLLEEQLNELRLVNEVKA
jgi:hypothetical protein